MKFDLNYIYEIFKNVKDKHDFKEYCDEMDENSKVLDTIPFDTQKAQQQISKLTTKYRGELNMLACLYGNNMSVTSQPMLKTAEILWNDLYYINQHIPLFALERKGISNFLNQNMGF
ncbi:MAG: hypothetical protein NC231_00450 [Bacillus sp. (in: Bacteria)]|nr:hypothetical protein [Bacillus sp. (in: firmicutes)]MCM1426500.1 hypothetical protein [Eubacterium sp.]